MTNIEYEITEKSVTIYDEYGYNILNIPTGNLLDFIEVEGLNLTDEKEMDFFEERKEEGGFNHTPIEVYIKQKSYFYLENNTEEVINSYLKDLLNNYEVYRKIK